MMTLLSGQQKMWFRLFPVQNSNAPQRPNGYCHSARARDRSGNTAGPRAFRNGTLGAGRGIGADSPTPPQAGMRPNFKIHRFNAVFVFSLYKALIRFPAKRHYGILCNFVPQIP
jgi:hypothetical protein